MKKTKSSNIVKYTLLLFLILLVAAELVFRNVFGLTDAVLFREDKAYEYIPIPQSRYRFGQNIYYNSLSQRNRELSPLDTNIILGFGDSVLNGGVLVDQDSLATTRLSTYLSDKYNRNILFTNISAPSWGPDNCYAYLERFGNFGAEQILLVVSSHDAYDNMNFDQVVGNRQNYPTSQYKFALVELVERYIYPWYIKPILKKDKDKKTELKDLGINKYKEGDSFNAGFENFKRYSDSTNIPLTIYLHAEIFELRKGKYNPQGRQIIKFCEENNIPLIKELDYNFPEDAYVDFIHLSEKGHRYMFEVLKNYF